MKLIPLSQGLFARVNDEDFKWLSRWKWSATHNGRTWYAYRSVGRWTGARKTIFMHVEILKPGGGLEIDHRDRDGLNNQRDNLRICTSAQNKQNRGLGSNNTSGYKGVSWNKAKRKWQVHIKPPYEKNKALGYFGNAQEAARAYDREAKRLYGEFACLNFPEE